MYKGNSIGVVVPCYNEETQIRDVLATMPVVVDHVLVVDDCSDDGTCRIVEEFIASDGGDESRVTLVRHETNRGVGAALTTGYREALRREIDITAVMAGDGQMDPDELETLLAPVADGEADYAKGNRLFYRDAWNKIPTHRYLGNAFLSLLTKLASGYWHVADSQTGYTAISREALETVDIEEMYPSYGYPNDMLVRLNVYDFRVVDVYIRPVYDVGEKSKMKLMRVVPRMSWLILKRFFWRMGAKYIVRDFHPLVLFYLSSGLLSLAGLVLFIRMIWIWTAVGTIPQMNALLWVFCSVTAVQFALFAMWFDMEMNRELCVRRHRRPRRRHPATDGDT